MSVMASILGWLVHSLFINYVGIPDSYVPGSYSTMSLDLSIQKLDPLYQLAYSVTYFVGYSGVPSLLH